MCNLKLRRYAARLIDSNQYLDSFPGATLSDKIGVTELDNILSNSMPNSWSNQAYVQGFDCESIFKRIMLTCLIECRLLNLFKKLQQNLIIKNLLGQIPTVMVTAGKIDDNPPLHRITPRWVRALASAEKNMQIARQDNQKHVSFTALSITMMDVRSWETLAISALKVSLLRTMGIIPYQGEKNHRQQENNAIVNNLVDEILLNEAQKVSAAREAPQFLDSDYYENALYQVERMIIEDTKQKL